MLRGQGGSVHGNIGDTCREGGGGSLDEEAHDMCKGEGWGSGGGLFNEASLNTCRREGGERGGGGGGWMLMDDASIDTIELERGWKPIRRESWPVNVAFGDACSGKWEDVDHSPKAWALKESLLKSPRSSSLEHDLD